VLFNVGVVVVQLGSGAKVSEFLVIAFALHFDFPHFLFHILIFLPELLHFLLEGIQQQLQIFDVGLVLSPLSLKPTL
jgi:hypothetical protein